MSKEILITCWIALCMFYTAESSCQSLGGKWYNQLGSELLLRDNSGGQLIGELRTAVEKTVGAAGHSETEIRGITAKFNSNTLFGFTAVFNGGSSVTSWTGQCMKCGNEDVMHTTWLLKTGADSCLNQWKSTLINEDIFIRRDVVSGPRKHLNIHFPSRSSEWVPVFPNFGSGPFLSNLRGKWYTSDGLELDLSAEESNGTIQGTYLDPTGKVLPIYGSFESRNPEGVFGLHAAWPNSESAQIWVGQYHYCEGGKEVLETSWLKRTKSPSCDRSTDSANFGRMTFLRTPPSKSKTTNASSQNWQFTSVFNNIATSISNYFTGLFGK